MPGSRTRARSGTEVISRIVARTPTAWDATIRPQRRAWADAPARRDGRHVRPDPPRPPGRRQRGRAHVRAGRGGLRAHRPAVPEGGAVGFARRGPVPDDG